VHVTIFEKHCWCFSLQCVDKASSDIKQYGAMRRSDRSTSVLLCVWSLFFIFYLIASTLNCFCMVLGKIMGSMFILCLQYVVQYNNYMLYRSKNDMGEIVTP
jgi:hypothetical protein